MSDSDRPTPAGDSPLRDAAEAAAQAEQLDRIDELTSLLVDEVIEEAQIAELEGLLRDSDEGRRRYIDGVQLHCDLMDYYADGRRAEGGQRTAVLGFLGDIDESGSHVPLPPTKPGA